MVKFRPEIQYLMHTYFKQDVCPVGEFCHLTSSDGTSTFKLYNMTFGFTYFSELVHLQ